jgi:hypothetical protein
MDPASRFTAEKTERAEGGLVVMGSGPGMGIQTGEKPEKNTDEHR